MSLFRVLGLAVAATLALAPAAGAGGRGHGGGGHQFVTGTRFTGVGRPGHFVPASVFTKQWYPPGQHHGSKHGGSRDFGGSFVSFGVVATPAVIYAPTPAPVVYAPSVTYEAPIYYPPVVYAPPTVSTVSLAPPPPAAPPTPSVVHFDTGRYELRGDGGAAPYTWVWIPNPPPAPPTTPPAAAAPAVDASRTRLSRLYRWTDDEGVVHMTDRWEAVPQRYRAEAKPPDR